MITVKIQGGLGNQIFQLAFLDYISDKYKFEAFIDDSDYLNIHSGVNYFDNIFINWKHLINRDIKIDNTICEQKNSLHTDWILIPNKNTKFIGYFQDYKYITEKLLNKLVFSDKILTNYLNIENCVFIHIRGGDYLSDNNTYLHNVNLDSYYNISINAFDKETQFVVFTNDRKYAESKQFLKNINYSFIDENEIDSLYLMSKCKAGICANSSFSWWGAFLNKYRVLCLPLKWYNDNSYYTEGYYFQKSNDIYKTLVSNCVDKVIYINLEKRLDRKQHIERALSIFEKDKIIRFNAIAIEGNGMLGCVLSHIEVLKLAEKNSWNNVLVLEDDTTWNDSATGYYLISSLIKNPYDVIMLGGSFALCDEETYKLHHAQTTSSYIVNKAYISRLRRNFEESSKLYYLHKNDCYALDIYWKKLQKEDNWYIINPPIMYQMSCYSDLQNKDTNYEFCMLKIDTVQENSNKTVSSLLRTKSIESPISQINNIKCKLKFLKYSNI